MRLVALGAAVILVGCATPKTYINPFITDQVAQSRQLAIDGGYCTRAAAGSVPIPQVRAYSSGQQNYTVTGTASTYNPSSGYSTSTYSGTARSTPSAGAAFAGGFADGLNMGAAIGARLERDKVYHGCMVALGWATSQEEAEHMRRERVSERQQDAQLLQETIDSVPELASWQANDTRRWDLAVEVDNELRARPDWGKVSPRLRFLEVVRRVNQMMADR